LFIGKYAAQVAPELIDNMAFMQANAWQARAACGTQICRS